MNVQGGFEKFLQGFGGCVVAKFYSVGEFLQEFEEIFCGCGGEIFAAVALGNGVVAKVGALVGWWRPGKANRGEWVAK